MRVLIACEFSGVVRDAFKACGHDAWSADIVPAKNHHRVKHIMGDVLHLFDKYGCPNCEGDGCERCAPFDLMIAHPPCTHLAVSGSSHFERKRRTGQQQRAIDFFMALAHAPVPRIAIENPVGIMSSVWRKPDQIIQPWEFGEDASKATCLWLQNLPPLQTTNVLPGGRDVRRANQTASGQNNLSPGYRRARLRSVTYRGIAEAMADQWGNLKARAA